MKIIDFIIQICYSKNIEDSISGGIKTMDREEITFIFEMLAAIAFGFSGAFLAIRKRYDLFGVITLAVITTVAVV